MAGKLDMPTQSPMLVAKAAFALFEKRYDWRNPIRLVTIRNHIYLHTDSEKDVQVLRERFLEWKNRNACKLNEKY